MKSKQKAKKQSSTSDSYHHGDLKKTLIDTAFKLLETVSPSQLSLRDVAKRAGVSQAAPYRHFKDKEALLAALSSEAFEMKYRLMKAGIDQAKGDGRRAFLNCGMAYFRMGVRYPQHFQLMFSDQCHPSEDHPELLISAISTFALVRDMVILAQSQKWIGPGDPYVLAMNCWAMVHGFTTLYSSGHLEWLGVNPKIAEKAFRLFLEQYLTGLKPGISEKSQEFQLFQGIKPQMMRKLMEQIRSAID